MKCLRSKRHTDSEQPPPPFLHVCRPPLCLSRCLSRSALCLSASPPLCLSRTASLPLCLSRSASLPSLPSLPLCPALWSRSSTYTCTVRFIYGCAPRAPQIRSYHVEYTASHQNCEVKRRWAYLVLRWGTTWEQYGAVSFFFCSPASQLVRRGHMAQGPLPLTHHVPSFIWPAGTGVGDFFFSFSSLDQPQILPR